MDEDMEQDSSGESEEEEEEGEEEEEEEEELVQGKKKNKKKKQTGKQKAGGRAASYCMSEDRVLTNCWLECSEDAITGTDQAMRTYWKKIEFKFAAESQIVRRNAKSLKLRWGTLQRLCEANVSSYISKRREY